MGTKLIQTAADAALAGKLSYSAPVFRGVVQELFPSSHVLLPQVSQIYELDLAYGEAQRLSAEELVERGAYFQSVNGTPTHHYRICMNTPGQVNASARQDRKNFFAANIFAVGYATHGLFPYRGKFHPQMIKAVMNVMGLKPGDTVVDPMAGCGTTSIEASIMGINSISCELSPFTCLMADAKLGALHMDCAEFPSLREHAVDLYRQIASPKSRVAARRTLFEHADAEETRTHLAPTLPNLDEPTRKLMSLCYLDAMGYARRRANKTTRDVFPDLVSRYLAAVEAFNKTRGELGLTLGHARVMQGDARQLEIEDESVDGIVFSPPYSFAIDYVENDRPQLEFLGVDVESLKQSMVGLTGSGRTRQQVIEQRVANYFSDMERILSHCKRVLRPGRYCVVVIGSNTNQTGGVSLEDGLVEISSRLGMPLEFRMMRQIEGIRNTMRDEFLLFLRKPDDSSPVCLQQ